MTDAAGKSFEIATLPMPGIVGGESTTARDLERLTREITDAKTWFGLKTAAPVRSCYEAGRDGFWLHRALTSMGIANAV